MAQQLETKQMTIQYGNSEDGHVMIILSVQTNVLKLRPDQAEAMIESLKGALQAAVEQRAKLAAKVN